MNVIIEGRQVFNATFAPSKPPGSTFAPRYSVTVQFPKSADPFNQSGGANPQEIALWSAVNEVALKTWGAEANDKLARIYNDILTGEAPRDSRISVQDGDQHQPDYNGGFWVIKPSRRENQGPPLVFDASEPPVQVFNPGDAGAPADGWAVAVLLSVWAQADQNRINFTVESIRGLTPGTRTGAAQVSAGSDIVAGFLGATSGSVGAILPGVTQGAPAIEPGAPAAQAQPVPAQYQGGPVTNGAAPVPQVPAAPVVPQGPPVAALVAPPAAAEKPKGPGLLKI